VIAKDPKHILIQFQVLKLTFFYKMWNTHVKAEYRCWDIRPPKIKTNQNFHTQCHCRKLFAQYLNFRNDVITTHLHISAILFWNIKIWWLKIDFSKTTHPFLPGKISKALFFKKSITYIFFETPQKIPLNSF